MITQYAATSLTKHFIISTCMCQNSFYLCYKTWSVFWQRCVAGLLVQRKQPRAERFFFWLILCCTSIKLRGKSKQQRWRLVVFCMGQRICIHWYESDNIARVIFCVCTKFGDSLPWFKHADWFDLWPVNWSSWLKLRKVQCRFSPSLLWTIWSSLKVQKLL